ncbi:hypothetical protein TTHERM_000216011 (macronuclear) [Tetrahymena thermophila SB210]|uniref:Uncharacterized protein n=1 Tax=Tetrahymena thermophila (strain SB210) TaxID=312017 RepID=W7X7C4_TETTS|nr:hypothetical protein TTHERM_000216011 [Tetrahymena thermophila SB210]EWS73262.1 hypothetical protein TTHERM_000216011 [Tetrahymena thermophila SB210]|eukprot:XP_012654171.1 hypothetical protein TTHERM_000216011 [Tetrahymena thermophila SB210]
MHQNIAIPSTCGSLCALHTQQLNNNNNNNKIMQQYDIHRNVNNQYKFSHYQLGEKDLSRNQKRNDMI